MRVSRALILLTAAVSCALVVSAASARTPATRVVIFRAFNGSGHPAIRILATVHGRCNGASAAIDRNDAWRCMSGNIIYDPCFSSPKARGFVLCVGAPWRHAGVKLRFTGHLTLGHGGPPSTSVLPWAIQTTAGAKCVIDTGATNAIHDVRANYYCSASNWLWGSPSRRSEPWTILSAPENARTLRHRVTIKVAWF